MARIRSWAPVPFAACALGLAGCGGSGDPAASLPSPPSSLGVSVLITGVGVVASPSSFGAGPVLLTVTNQAGSSQSLQLSRGRGAVLARTAPLNPQGSTQLSVVLRRGHYTLSTRSRGPTATHAIRPQTIIVGRTRPSSGSSLLTP